MAYEKLGFVDKETPLDAAHFNHMEGGIETANSVLETTTTNEITWDGVVGDRVTVDLGDNMLMVHMSDHVPARSMFDQGFTFSMNTTGGIEDVEMPAGIVEEVFISDTFGSGTFIFAEFAFLVATDDGIEVSFDGGDSRYVIPKKGIYFACGTGEEPIFTVKLTSPLLSVPTTKIKKEALPDDIGGDLPDVTSTDAGKFLRVSSEGVWAAETIPNAEEASF